MKALVLEENAHFAYKDVPDPAPRPGLDAVVEVHSAGICGSDLPRAFGNGAYHYPLVLGHEFSGIVHASPPGCGFSPGDRVTAFPLIPCGSCAACQTGNHAQCSNYDYLGSRRDGAFAQFVSVPVANLFRLPERVQLLDAAMTEPCAVALHGVEKLQVEAGMSALVIGGGPVGLMAAQWLRVKGCGEVAIADVDARKLELAASLGFIPFNSSSGDCGSNDLGSNDPVEFARSRWDGGADCVVEACGLPSTFLQAVRAAGRAGQVLFMGNIHGEFRVPERDFSRILRNELRIVGTWNSRMVPRGRDEWTRVLAELGGRVRVDLLVSHHIPLSGGAAMLERMQAKSEWYTKVVLEP